MINVAEIFIHEFGKELKIWLKNNLSEITYLSIYTVDDFVKNNDPFFQLDWQDLENINAGNPVYLDSEPVFGSDRIEGIYLIRINNTISDEVIYPIANLTPYALYIASLLLRINVENCKFKIDSNCGICIEEVIFMNTLLNTLKYLIYTNHYQDINNTLYKLNNLFYCEECKNNPEALIIGDLNYGILNNKIVSDESR